MGARNKMGEKQITKSDICEIYKHVASKVIVNENLVSDKVNGILAHFRDTESVSDKDYIGFCLQLIMLEVKKQITFLVEDKLSELVGENVCLTEHVEFKK